MLKGQTPFFLYGNVNADFGGGGGDGGGGGMGEGEGKGPRDRTESAESRGREGGRARESKATIIEQRLLHHCTERPNERPTAAAAVALKI